MTGNGSNGNTTRGSRIRPTTAAALRRHTVPPMSKVYEYPSGGRIEIPLSRRREALASKNERAKFAKELLISRVYAQAGAQIIFTPQGAGTHDIFYNGIPAEIKRISSHNNILKEAHSALKKQGAKIVLFEFTKETPQIHNKISELKRKGYHGHYFFSGRKTIYNI